MEKCIACCGIDCATCNARIATVTDDNGLRTKVAEEWKIRYHVPELLPEMINCAGCMEPGAKIGHCEECEIRTCALSKNYRTCAECDAMETCLIIKKVHQYVPDALDNLRSLN
jgi:hypothetical protein